MTEFVFEASVVKINFLIGAKGRKMVINLYRMIAHNLILLIGLKGVHLKKLREIAWKCNKNLRENFLIYLILNYVNGKWKEVGKYSKHGN